MLDDELKRLKPTQENKSKGIWLACIYVGYDTLANKPYIGKTIGEPEYRWKEHRSCGTGPFKNGSSYAKWEVIRENVDLKELDKLESYFIGSYNSFEDGHNDNRGNDLTEYEKGKRESQISVLEK
ncbi:MAG: GIY-YIG nuclease family protein [Ignavibacteriales bacterium]|nr:GIY-YIG nuclease family protein [Ignavibacteriales bacterium]